MALETLVETNSLGSMLQGVSGLPELCLSGFSVTPAQLRKMPSGSRYLSLEGIYSNCHFPVALQVSQLLCYKFKYTASICSNIQEYLWFYIFTVIGYKNFQTQINSGLWGRKRFIILIDRWGNRMSKRDEVNTAVYEQKLSLQARNGSNTSTALKLFLINAPLPSSSDWKISKGQ